MCIDAHVPSCARKTLSFSIGDMLLCLGISVLLCHAKVNEIHHVGMGCARSANEEIVWFDVSVDQVVLMNAFYSCNLSIPSTSIQPTFSCLSLTICRANMATVFMLNRLEHLSNKSSRLGPNKSITSIL